MKKYIIFKPEVWYSKISIEANSKEEAIKLVNAGEGESMDIEYSHDYISGSTWEPGTDGIYEVIEEEIDD